MKESLRPKEVLLESKENNNKLTIKTDLNIPEHFIEIDINKKTIKNIKSFFEKLIFYRFEENIKLRIKEEYNLHPIISDDEEEIKNLLDKLIQDFNNDYSN